MAVDTGWIATENQFPCWRLGACLSIPHPHPPAGACATDIRFVARCAWAHRPCARRYISNRLAWSYDRAAVAAQPEVLYEFVVHANHGAPLITDGEAHDGERLHHLFRMNVLAGQRATAVDAYSFGMRYFAVANTLIPGTMWADDYATALSLHLRWMECTYLMAEEMEAERIFKVPPDPPPPPFSTASLPRTTAGGRGGFRRSV